MRVRSIGDAAAVVRGRRLELKLSQDELARRAGVSRKWVYEFEAGKPAAELGHVIRVLDALGVRLEATTAAAPDESSGFPDLDALLDEYRHG